MVAITVILAAVIGTFVLGLGDSLNQAPQSTLSADAGNNSSVTISHDGGDGMTVSDLQINIGSTSFNFSDADGYSSSDEFTVGDSATFTDGNGLNSDTVGSNSGGEVRVRVIHGPSESVLMDKTIDVPA
ncbi:type IV pilin [Halolamina salifodinae]|uniref:FlaG/FlaF family flagellin (Archaellin) n=2 Tax=Halolamina salifodinae TaxID=1202767 RepID=A0A8T4GW43_9EURY|nr:FlaG/FlaF family flagellin (archaellin) [Halolamina salifodinae]